MKKEKAFSVRVILFFFLANTSRKLFDSFTVLPLCLIEQAKTKNKNPDNPKKSTYQQQSS